MFWIYHGNEIKSLDDLPEVGYIGFVYQITNLVSDKKYIGKKLLKFTRTKKVNGKNKKVQIDSDWQQYFGSNKILNEDVVLLGEDKFKREILYFCKTKGHCNYLESMLQFQNKVLESDEWYNENIMCKIHGSHVRNFNSEKYMEQSKV